MTSSPSPVLSSETLLVRETPSFDLKVIANRYTPRPPFALSEDAHAVTLVFLHSQGFSKEMWEPVIERMLSRASSDGDKNRALRIREIYSIESPNHGESSILNEEVLDKNYLDFWTVRMYSRAAQQFLTAGEENGAKVDFTTRRLIGIGHSMGAAALVLLMNLVPQLHFERLLLVEAAISRHDIPERFQMTAALTYFAWSRRDVWMSRGQAMKEFKANPVYSNWHPRMFELFSRYSLREHPAAKYPEPYRFNGVTTALTKRQEAACARDEELVYGALKEYAELTRRMPIHIIFGDTPDISPVELQHVHKDPELGCYPASVSYIQGVGHLAIQQDPDASADEFYNILVNLASTDVKPLKASL